MIISGKNDQDLNHLKNKISAARKKLQSAWAVSNRTDPSVLAAGDEFDKLMNEYLRLSKK
ncbi:MAG TPA: sporulation protein Spo0E [Firmicutes bacterium]|nr:sporulation protein Spo0E [Bacillota bacterium]